MSDEKSVITIDGPSGVGKGTVAKIVAEKLKFSYLDTGAMYRAFALKVLKSKIHKRAAYGEATSFGQGVFEYDNSKARKEITAMVGEIIKHV